MMLAGLTMHNQSGVMGLDVKQQLSACIDIADAQSMCRMHVQPGWGLAEEMVSIQQKGCRDKEQSPIPHAQLCLSCT